MSLGSLSLHRLLLMVTGFSATALQAQSLHLEFPIVDLPYNVSAGYSSLSFSQSLSLSNAFYKVSHKSISKLFEEEESEDSVFRRVALQSSVSVFDLLSVRLPGGLGWMHEEWHRSIMARRGVKSSNGIYAFDLFSAATPVDRVSDEGLARIKQFHPADFVRLSSAGMEAQLVQNVTIKQGVFFDEESYPEIPLLWINNIVVASYLKTCAGPQADVRTDELSRKFGASAEHRDFMGLDCTGWVYDLFRPDESYATRGMDADSAIVDRYIRWSDLGEAEQNFLKRQSRLSYLNFLDPQLIGFRSIRMGEWDTNFQIQHYMTSFGYVVTSNIFLKKAALKVQIKGHSYSNAASTFPGIEAEFPGIQLYGSWDLSARTGLWLQPQNQRYDDKRAKFGGILTLKGVYKLNKTWGFFAQLESKTQGWVAGNMDLDAKSSVLLGLRTTVF